MVAVIRWHWLGAVGGDAALSSGIIIDIFGISVGGNSQLNFAIFLQI